MLSLKVWNDVNTLTGIIKAFLRRLPVPLFTSGMLAFLFYFLISTEMWQPLLCHIKQFLRDSNSTGRLLEVIRRNLYRVTFLNISTFLSL